MRERKKSMINSRKSGKNGVLVRLVSGLTLGPKIAITDSRDNFLGFFSMSELKEYASKPADCRRRWKQSRKADSVEKKLDFWDLGYTCSAPALAPEEQLQEDLKKILPANPIRF